MRIGKRLTILCGLLVCWCAAGAGAAWGQARVFHVDASKVTGKIRSFQGVNGQPTPVMAGLPNLVEQYKDLHVNFVRTHDFMGPTELDSIFRDDDPLLKWLVPDNSQRHALVVAGNASIIFPDESADPEKPESYRFGPTDEVIRAIRASGAEVYYRVGRSFGVNRNPPKDFAKFASVAKHIAMHYNQGWANGFHEGIRYWEFWNEPELFWSGTAEQFYELYAQTSRALKSVDPTLKVGGDAKAFAMSPDAYRDGFLDYCAAKKLPLDFYSWHTYANGSDDPYDAFRIGEEIRKLLDAKGFAKAESILSEWNLSADFTEGEAKILRSARNAAFVGSALIYLQDSKIDQAEFYRGDAAWMGLFGLHREYFKPAHTFKAASRLLETPERLELSGSNTFGFAALSGRSTEGKTVQILISNYQIPVDFKPNNMIPPADVQALWHGIDFSKLPSLPTRQGITPNEPGYELSIDKLPWGSGEFTIKRYRISETEDLKLVEEKTGRGGNIKIANAMPVSTVELIVLQAR